MVPSRNGPKGAEVAAFGLATLIFLLTPAQVGHQDIGALLAQQPSVATRSREHLIASPFGTIHAAMFAMPRPVGIAIPEVPLVRLASLSSDITGSIGVAPLPAQRTAPHAVFPAINRAGKGDRLVPSTPAASEPEPMPARIEPPKPSILPAQPKSTELDLIDHTDDELPDAQTVILAEIARDAHRRNVPPAPQDEIVGAMHFEPFPEYDISLSLEMDPKIIEDMADVVDLDPTTFTPNAPPSLEGLNAEVKEQQLYFGNDLLGTSPSGIKPWQVGEVPVLEGVPAADPDFKQTPAVAANDAAGVTVAGKGQVTGEDQRPKTPAERLALVGPKRVKAEKCLANAVYFEARSEPVRGQIAVAQVVLNRAFSGKYPETVCGVVYQNKHRHLACQFTFACDNNKDVIREPDMWERARKIAKAMLDGQLWLPEVGKSTHYHAYWVRPSWVNEMKKMYKFGVHTFYRPRAWGDGSEAPSWGTSEQTAAISAKLAEAAQSSAEQASARR